MCVCACRTNSMCFAAGISIFKLILSGSRSEGCMRAAPINVMPHLPNRAIVGDFDHRLKRQLLPTVGKTL